MKPLQADAILACLERNGVRYVLIGASPQSSTAHPRPRSTDICPARDGDNLERLAEALRQMRARIRTPDVDAGLAFTCDAAFLRGMQVLNLVTDFGDLNLSFVPAGTEGYEDLAKQAVPIAVKGSVVSIAALEDIIRSKEATNRPKDLAALPILRQLLNELKKRG